MWHMEGGGVEGGRSMRRKDSEDGHDASSKTRETQAFEAGRYLQDPVTSANGVSAPICDSVIGLFAK